jgi:ribosomal-protein-alanine N-acetyltransferase
MSAVLAPPPEARLEPVTVERIPAICAIERSTYSHPWTPAHFIDSLAAGYRCRCLVGPSRHGPEAIIGYFIAMKGVDEVHLLNITVAPAFRRQGWGRLMLDVLALWSRAQGAQWLWLEVRAGNRRALAVYERHGFRRVGVRKAYYPESANTREDAVVMSLRIDESNGAGRRA